MNRRFDGAWAPIASLVVLVFGLVVLALGAIGATTKALHPGAGGASRTGSIVQALIFAGLFVMFAYAAVHAEHQLRHARSAAGADGAGGAGNSVPPPPALWSVGPTSRRHGPVAQVTTALALLGATIFGFVAAVDGHAAADKSDRTQSGGRSTSAVVVVVQHIYHQSRHSGWYTALLTVREPDGTLTVVHDPQDTDLDAGAVVQILVDPRDPSYAEFPGQPAATTAGWVFGLVIGLLFATMDVQAWRVFLRMRRPRRVSPSAAPPVLQGA